MNIYELLKKINLQADISNKVLNLISNNDFSLYINDLTLLDKAEETYNNLLNIYSFDPENIYILTIYLLSSLKTYENYLKLGIDESIFIDTMKCFTRFIDECYIKTGKYYFDRSWWTYRQTRLSLFRIKELEYEFDYDAKVISIHIPSDSNLTKENIETSLKEAKLFINKYFNEYKDWPFFCESWLLSLNLKKYLNKDSKILLLQSYFDIYKMNDDDNSIYEWLFKVNGKVDLNTIICKTSLQKSIKTAMLKGEIIGCGYGLLKKEVFK